MNRQGIAGLLVVAIVVSVRVSVGAEAGGSSVPWSTWTDGPSMAADDRVKPPYGTWAEAAGVVSAEGKVDRWSTRLMPGDPGADTRVTVRFVVTASSKARRGLPGGCVRWGFHWGEHLPGWDVGVVLRFADALHFYRVCVSASRGELALWDSTGAFLQVVPCPVKLGGTHTLVITSHGAHFVAAVDGQTVMDYWDRTLAHATGRVGLAVWHSKARFERFEVARLKPDPTPMPAHTPALRLVATDGTAWTDPGKTTTPGGELVLMDGAEPISRYWRRAPHKRFGHCAGVLFHEAVKVKPGWRPAYYTWIGPGINQRVLPLVGDLPGALKVEAQGKTLRLRFRTEQADLACADHVCTVRYDAQRGVYRYEYRADVRFTAGKPYRLHAFELTDPLTYNNRTPGPEVVNRWNPAGHRWHLYQGPGQGWFRYPMVDFLGGDYNNQTTHWGRFADILYPDPAACPTIETDVGWVQPSGSTTKQKRVFCLGLCTWGYDYHHTEVGPHRDLAPGTKRRYGVTLTAMPPAEAKRIFEQSAPSPKIADATTPLAVFDPAGTTFARTTTVRDPSATMVWAGGVLDRSVGRTDSHSLRIDGPDSVGLHLYQYMIEQHASRWWVRGWVRSQAVRGRGLQLRVKYAYAKEPQDLFYLGGLGDRDWTRFSFVTEVFKHRDCTSVQVELDGPGQAWLDDVAISALDPTDAPKTTSFPLPKGLEPRTDVLIDLPMAERPGKAVYDKSRNGHALYLHGPTWVQEAGRGMLRFDGKDDYAQLPTKPVLEPRDAPPEDQQYKPIFRLKTFTYEWWVRLRKPAGKQGRMFLFHYRFNPQVYCDRLRAKPGECRLVYQNDVYRGAKVRLETTVPYDRWLHVAATHGDGRVVLYVDGREVGRATYDASALGFGFSAYKWQYNVGAWYNGSGNHLTGDLGPFRLYPRVLSADEVGKRFQSGWGTGGG